MPPLISLQEFLATALNRVAPPAQRTPVLIDIAQEVVPVLDLSRQADQAEWADVTGTTIVTMAPIFTVERNAVDEISRYHFIGVHNLSSGPVQTWSIETDYPGLAERQQQRHTVGTGDLRNLLNMGEANAVDSDGSGRTYTVLPRGQLRVRLAVGTLVTGQQVRFSILRERLAGLASAERITGLLTGQFDI